MRSLFDSWEGSTHKNGKTFVARQRTGKNTTVHPTRKRPGRQATNMPRRQQRMLDRSLWRAGGSVLGVSAFVWVSPLGHCPEGSHHIFIPGFSIDSDRNNILGSKCQEHANKCALSGLNKCDGHCVIQNPHNEGMAVPILGRHYEATM